ncbi:hypothetical protein BV898_10525 [Hypsibius exemplaris]|uniref:Uncharacterized protein n=1 Tax=Hypsibius exemplaris TaxID=2072580 RepID=A0A1W0WJA7_HYPEX|nr:hypothetical protein BV898_10525 [Hypsibius exemplaris]
MLPWKTTNTSGISQFPVLSHNLTQAKQNELSAWIVVTWPKGRKNTSGMSVPTFHYVAINLLMGLVNNPVSIFLIQTKPDGYRTTFAALSGLVLFKYGIPTLCPPTFCPPDILFLFCAPPDSLSPDNFGRGHSVLTDTEASWIDCPPTFCPHRH